MVMSFGKLISRLGNSVTLWTLAMVVAVDLLVVYVNPLRYVNDSAYIGLNQNPVVSKLPEFINSLRNPDMIIVGSSLMLVPAVRCDDTVDHVRTRYDGWYYRNHIQEYNRSEYLQKSLSRALGQDIQIVNLGVVGSMMSDHYLIFKKTIDAGKTPKLVICGVAPRDFMDNCRAEVEQTPTYKVLADVTSIKDILENQGADAKESSENNTKNLPQNTAKNIAKNIDRLGEFATSKIWHYFGARSDYRDFLVAMTATATGRPMSLYMANVLNAEKQAGKHKQDPQAQASLDPDQDMGGVGVLTNSKPKYEHGPNVLSDITLYKTRVYSPFNPALYNQQMKYLEKLLSLAQERQIPLLLVNMPITDENIALLPNERWQGYKKQLHDLATSYGATFFDPKESENYLTSDFEDSCHMDTKAGFKFYNQLVESIVKNQALNTSLCSRGQLIGQR